MEKKDHAEALQSLPLAYSKVAFLSITICHN